MRPLVFARPEGFRPNFATGQVAKPKRGPSPAASGRQASKLGASKPPGREAWPRRRPGLQPDLSQRGRAQPARRSRPLSKVAAGPLR
jgi:hypothetical protein